MEQTVSIKINNQRYEAKVGQTILEVAREHGYDIPTLCHYKGLVSSGACRVCVVEVKNARNLQTACTYQVHDGLEVFLNTPRVMNARKTNVELMLSNHNKDCLSCQQNGKCELQKVADIVGARTDHFIGDQTKFTLDEVSPSICRDTSKCILCGRCIAACKKYQGIGILGFEGRGFNTSVSPAENRSFNNVPCLLCGQCVLVCPTGALFVKEEKDRIYEAMKQGKYIVCQVAPAVRVSLGDEFGMRKGKAVTGKMITALRQLGFRKVYDVNWSADLTVMEEGAELLTRIQKGGKLPMITSCSPGWVRYAEYYYPELLPHLSTCKSPHMMSGAILKSYYAMQKNLDPNDIYVVSVMPCSAKKFEKEREEMFKEGRKDVDAVITTRELADMIRAASIDFASLEDGNWDPDILGNYTGAGVIFGVTGGVMEAALRTVYSIVEKKEYGPIEFEDCRGFEKVKEASITLNVNGEPKEIKVAIAHSMVAAKPLLEEIKAGTSPYTFIEIMGCPGGCINGGGQSFDKVMLQTLKDKIVRQEDEDFLKKARAQGLYGEDKHQQLRAAHLNPQIQTLYREYLGKPNSHLAHELLHTHYVARKKY